MIILGPKQGSYYGPFNATYNGRLRMLLTLFFSLSIVSVSIYQKQVSLSAPRFLQKAISLGNGSQGNPIRPLRDCN